MKKATLILIIAAVLFVSFTAVWAGGLQIARQSLGQWRVTPMNNGGYRIEGDLPLAQVTVPEPTPAPTFAFEGINYSGQATEYVVIPVDHILSVGAEAWPVYNDERDTVIAIRYGTAIRYGDGRWAWVDRELHDVVAELMSKGWALGVVPDRWTHPLEGSLPVPSTDWR